MKIARAKAAHEARLAQTRMQKNGDQLRAPVEAVKDLSYAKSEDLWKDREQVRMVASALKNVYFALRDAGEMLDRCLHRFWLNEREMARQA